MNWSSKMDYTPRRGHNKLETIFPKPIFLYVDTGLHHSCAM